MSLPFFPGFYENNENIVNTCVINETELLICLRIFRRFSVVFREVGMASRSFIEVD